MSNYFQDNWQFNTTNVVKRANLALLTIGSKRLDSLSELEYKQLRLGETYAKSTKRLGRRSRADRKGLTPFPTRLPPQDGYLSRSMG